MTAGRKPVNGGEKAKEAGGLDLPSLALDALPAPPEYFGPVAREIYRIIARTLASARAIAEGDVPLIVQAARAYERWFELDVRIVEEDAEVTKNKAGTDAFMSGLAQARAAAARDYRELASELGMSPVARHRLTGTAQSSFMDALEETLAARRGETGELDPFAPLH